MKFNSIQKTCAHLNDRSPKKQKYLQGKEIKLLTSHWLTEMVKLWLVNSHVEGMRTLKDFPETSKSKVVKRTWRSADSRVGKWLACLWKHMLKGGRESQERTCWFYGCTSTTCWTSDGDACPSFYSRGIFYLSHNAPLCYDLLRIYGETSVFLYLVKWKILRKE